MKNSTILCFGILFLIMACQSNADKKPDSEKIIGSWIYEKEHLGEIEYQEDGTAISHAEEDYTYGWTIDEDDKTMTTSDDFTTTTYSYTFAGKDTLNLQIIDMKDKNGEEVPYYKNMSFQLVRKK